MPHINGSIFYRAAQFCSHIDTMHSIIKNDDSRKHEMNGPITTQDKKVVARTLRALKSEISILGIKLSLLTVDRALAKLQSKKCTYEMLDSFITSLNGRLEDELSQVILIVVRENNANFYSSQIAHFGNEVENVFTTAAEDISEAAKCFALERYTALVFHLMRAMEIAVAALASKLQATTVDKNGVQLPWGPLVSNISDKVKTMPAGNERNNLAEVATLLVHVKDAWRNPTMHPKQTYTEDQAKVVFDAVGAFMKRLAPLI